MSLVLLARHGQALPQDYVGRAAGQEMTGGCVGLTDLGRRQARALGESLRLRGIRPDRVIHGGLARQTETAEQVAHVLGSGASASIEVDDRWQEYDLRGVLAAYPPEAPGSAGADLDDPSTNPRMFQRLLDIALRAWMADPAPPAALGTWKAFTTRASTALADVAAGMGRGSTALVVTSAGPISTAVTGLWGLERESFLSLHRIVLNGSLTKLIVGGQGIHVLSVNEHAHLDGAGSDAVTYR